MSYMGYNDRFSHTAIRETETDLLANGQEAIASVAYEAMRSINNAEDAIRRENDRIRARLDQAMADLNAGRNVYPAGITDNAVTLNEAIAARDLHFKVLVGLLGQDKMNDLMKRPAK